MDVNGAAALVTGGASGFGEAMARRFAADGARVVIADLDGDAATRVAADLGGHALQVDVGSAAANAAMIGDAEAQVGPIDLLVLNAGVAVGGDVDAPDEAWDLAWRVNVMAHVWAVRAWLPGALERGGGYVLHTVSAAGLLTNIGAAPYSVTKHAVQALAEWLAVTHGDAGLKVSTLNPQFVQTPLLDALKDVPGGKGLASSNVKQPSEVADAVAEAIAEERFLVLPHPEVATYEQNRANDRDRWLGGMRRLQAAVIAAD